MFSLTMSFREPKSDVNNAVSSPTYHKENTGSQFYLLKYAMGEEPQKQ